MAQTMAEYLIQQGEARGEKRGEMRARRDSILKLVEMRFNEVPQPLAQRIARIRSIKRLDMLFEEAIAAERIEDIDW